jgi:hypothetical protein
MRFLKFRRISGHFFRWAPTPREVPHWHGYLFIEAAQKSVFLQIARAATRLLRQNDRLRMVAYGMATPHRIP